MFVVLRRAQILVVFALILAVAAIPLLSLWQQSAQASPLSIAIDPGHGGYDGGVKGLQTGVKESDVNLSVARYLATYLRNAGYQTVLTRDSAKSPVEEVRPTLSDVDAGVKKVRDMRLRLQAVEQADCVLLVSIHCNFYPSSYRRGVQVFFGKQADEALAQALQAHLNQAFNLPTVGRDFPPLWGDYYLLANAPCPAAIVECGFLSNPQDEALLTDATYRMTLAYELSLAIQAHLGKTA